jgi:hypothetical protein
MFGDIQRVVSQETHIALRPTKSLNHAHADSELCAAHEHDGATVSLGSKFLLRGTVSLVYSRSGF